jgi:hypothetical protein
LSEKREDSCERRSLISRKRAFWSVGRAAPPRRKSRSSFSTIFLRARDSDPNEPDSRSA